MTQKASFYDKINRKILINLDLLEIKSQANKLLLDIYFIYLETLINFIL